MLYIYFTLTCSLVQRANAATLPCDGCTSPFEHPNPASDTRHNKAREKMVGVGRFEEREKSRNGVERQVGPSPADGWDQESPEPVAEDGKERGWFRVVLV